MIRNTKNVGEAVTKKKSNKKKGKAMCLCGQHLVRRTNVGEIRMQHQCRMCRKNIGVPMSQLTGEEVCSCGLRAIETTDSGVKVNVMAVPVCSRGDIISSERVAKYDPKIRVMIHAHLPACRLHEASMSMDDLMNHGRFQVYLAIKDGLDFEKVVPSSEMTPDESYERAERWAVDRRLRNWLTRIRAMFHPDQRGGRTVSYESIVASIALDYDGVAKRYSEEDAIEQEAPAVEAQDDLEQGSNDMFTCEAPNYSVEVAKEIVADLLKVQETGGDVKAAYNALTEEQKAELSAHYAAIGDGPIIQTGDQDDSGDACEEEA